MIPFFKSLVSNNITDQLAKTDSLYKGIISHLPVGNRISHCESLIYGTQEDLMQLNCKEKHTLNKRLKAAQIELKKNHVARSRT